MKNISCLIILGLLIAGILRTCWPEIVLAEDLPERPPATALLGYSISDIPESDDENRQLFLRKDNATLFDKLLLAPLAAWLKDGRLVIRVVRKLNFDWVLNDEWEKNSRFKLERRSLDAGGNLVYSAGLSGFANPVVSESPAGRNLEKLVSAKNIVNHQSFQVPKNGYPFGMALDINKETDSAVKAKKILWNVVFAEKPGKDIFYGSELVWVGERSALRRSSGAFYRYFPWRAESSAANSAATTGPATGQSTTETTAFEQEVFRLFSPPVVFGFSVISWRSFGVKDDKVWLYSPVIGKTRRLLPSNRSDAVLGSALSLDDMLVWSSKPQTIDAKVVEEKLLFVPFPAVDTVSMEKSHTTVEPETEQTVRSVAEEAEEIEPGVAEDTDIKEKVWTVHELYSRSGRPSANMLWNFETKRFLQAAPWVPTQAVFVPRRVWILEVTHRDPYYLAGREILVVDQESMLPVYKVVYSQSGKYLKTVIGGWALASSTDNTVRFPFAAFVLSVPFASEPAIALTTTRVYSFLGEDSAQAREVRSWLDVSTYTKTVDEADEEVKVGQGKRG